MASSNGNSDKMESRYRWVIDILIIIIGMGFSFYMGSRTVSSNIISLEKTVTVNCSRITTLESAIIEIKNSQKDMNTKIDTILINVLK